MTRALLNNALSTQSGNVEAEKKSVAKETNLITQILHFQWAKTEVKMGFLASEWHDEGDALF